MKRPHHPYPDAPATSGTSTPSVMPIWIQDPSIKGVSFDQLLSQRGIRLIHRKAMPCPNIVSTEFMAHQPDCSFCDDSGIVYYDEKEIYGIFSGNSIEKTFEAHGVWEVGSAVITVPTEYPDGTQADFNTYDQLIIPDFPVRLWQLKEYDNPSDLTQTLRYPVKRVEMAMSITDNVQTIYKQGVDFSIDSDGDIVWISGREPDYDATIPRGEVVGWSYFAHPVYVVIQSLRELRITQEMVDGVKQARRLPMQILVKRDFLFGSGEKIANSGE